jgi:DNA-binding NtrC family response regulator
MAPIHAANTEPPIRFGLTAVILTENLRFLDEWSQYLEQKMDRKVEFVLRKSYREVMDLLESGGIEFAWICGFPYVQTRKPEYLQLLTVPVYRGSPRYHSFIIVPRDSPYKRFSDLKGKIFAFSDPDSNSGALDYLTKPFEIGDFIKKVEHHLSCIADTRLISGDSGAAGSSFKPGSGHLGKNPAMRRIERLVARLGGSDSSVLLTGESGVGKEVVATLIHNNSLRAQGPMIKVNCAALSSSLIESELFGHEKGAFTGATQQRIGRFEQAQGGTIFLDEIAEVSPDIQVKLLRVLQEREIERVGGVEPITLDIRVIAATQVVLEESIKKNDFRSDLYWRLNVIHVDIPPLRERQEDIVYLARLFVSELTAKTGSAIKGLSKEAELQLQSMAFPGNVRELKNIIERAVALCDAPWIGAGDLLIRENSGHESSATTLRESIEEAERKAISKALAENGGKINQAADSLGISRKNLWEKMKRYGIEK